MPGYQVPLTTVDANTTINNQKLVTTGNDIGKNYIINGDFSIWQRGTSFTGAGFTADRWHVHDGSSSVVITKTADGISLSGTTAAFAAGNTFNGLEYRGIESQDMYNVLSSGPMTFSWKMKSTVNATICLRMDLFDSNGTRHSYTPLISVSQSSTFVKYSVVIPQNSIVTRRSNEQGFQPQFVFVESRSSFLGGSATEWNSPATKLTPQSINAFSGGNATFEITEVQLEKGAVQTPFARRPIGEELALCQRYYWRNTASQTYTQFSSGLTWGSGDARFVIIPPVTMRGVPSMSSASLGVKSSNGSVQTVTAFAIESGCAGTQSVGVIANAASGLTANYPATLQANNNAAAYIELSAEL